MGILGIITDIHANSHALAAVLNHGAGCGVDRWLVLGDVVAMGPEPGRVLDQLSELDVVAFIAGNTERYVLTGDRRAPTYEEVAADSTLLPHLVEVVGSFAWTKGFLSAHGSLDFVSSFRPKARFLFPDGTRALAVHASLHADDGRGIAPDVDAEVMDRLFPTPDATLIFGGHTHMAADLEFNGTRFVNPGSVSNHLEPHVNARYSTVRLAERHHEIEHHDVPYDKQLAIDAIARSGMPGSGFLLRWFFDSTPSV